MPSDRIPALAAGLIGLGGQRVWSLLVSVFGDLAREEGEGIDGPVLSAIMSAMDVRPEALRVALHRLRNDGWITSEKFGRTRRHSLTAYGRSESAAASPRIYGAPDQSPADWQIALASQDTPETQADFSAAGFAPLFPRVYVAARTSKPPSEALCLTGGLAPDWLKREFACSELSAEYHALLVILRKVDKMLPEGTRLDPLDCAVLRCLIVHHWRRIVLRHPDLPRSLYPDEWAGHDCRALVARLLHRFPRPALGRIAV